MEPGSEEWVRKVFNVKRPVDWAFVMGCRGTSSGIPDEQKWCGLPQASYLYHKEFIPHYHGGATADMWDYWMKFGYVVDANTPELMCRFATVVAVYGKDEVEKILIRCMPKYLKYELPDEPADPYPNAVPMPGAGQKQTNIKDVKGERLS